MSSTQDDHPRASNGRFVKRRSGQKGRAGAMEGAAPGPVRSREGMVPLALLTVAVVLAVLGFALSLFWVASLVLLGVLWGVMVAEHARRRGSAQGLAAELISTVVDEAKGIRDATSGSESNGASRAQRPAQREA